MFGRRRHPMPCPQWISQRFWQHPASMFLWRDLGAEPSGREYPGASSARTPSTRRMYRMLGRWVG